MINKDEKTRFILYCCKMLTIWGGGLLVNSLLNKYYGTHIDLNLTTSVLTGHVIYLCSKW